MGEMIDTLNVRVLGDGDRAPLDVFLMPQVASSMFLISNSRKVGLRDQGRRFEGTYAAAFERERIVAVAAHYWNRYLIMQAPLASVAVCQKAASASGRVVEALIGPAEQVEQVRQAIGVLADQIKFDELEYLYALDLASLRIPDALIDGQLRVRPVAESDLELATDWRVGYGIELMGERDDAEHRRRSRASVESAILEGSLWLLEDQSGQPLAQNGFNATLDHAVQIGGVWTPPRLRGRGYARAVVAGSLQAVRAQGVRQAVLFTGVENLAAQKAYLSIGFEPIGQYRVLTLRTPVSWV